MTDLPAVFIYFGKTTEILGKTRYGENKISVDFFYREKFIVIFLIQILASDTVGTLAERIQKIEHRILPLCVKLLLEGIIVPGPGGLTLNGKPLPACGIPLEQLESTYGHACQS